MNFPNRGFTGPTYIQLLTFFSLPLPSFVKNSVYYMLCVPKIPYQFIILFSLLLSLNNSKVYSQGTSNKGTDFWVPFAGHVDGKSARLALFITSEEPATVKITSKGFNQTLTIQAFEARSIVINPEIYDVYIGTSDGTEKGKAIHVSSDKAIVVYAHISHLSRSAASLVYPTKSLGNDYYAISYDQLPDGPLSNGQIEVRSSQFTVVGIEDGTEIEINPSQDSRSNTAHIANTPFRIKLDKGDVYQYQSKLDLSGSRLRTVNGCKPFSVFSGSSKNGFCEAGSDVASASGQDNLYQQLLPIVTWGKNFVTAPFYNTIFGSTDIYRIQVAEDNTVIRVNGSELSANGSPLNNPYNKGSIVTFFSRSSNTIQASRPINVTQFQTSQNCNPNNNGFSSSNAPYPGDPEMTILSPVEQALKDVTVYSAISIASAPTAITKHYLNIILKNSDAASLTVDGSGFRYNPEGAAFALNKFIKIDSIYCYVIADVTSTSLIKPTHRIKANGGFIALSYGYGVFETYGYLAGTDLRNLSKIIQPENLANGEVISAGCPNTPLGLSLILPFKTSSLSWDLGDGIIKTDPNPNDHYTTLVQNNETLYKYGYFEKSASFLKTGNYIVKASFLNPNPLACNGIESTELSLNIADLPNASFTLKDIGCLNASFEDNSISNGHTIKKWIWDFGEGESPETRINPDKFVHNFKKAGDYTVKLSVETTNGCSSESSLKLVHIPYPQAGFKISSAACAGEMIKFSDASASELGTINKWSWNFGDDESGTANTSDKQSPQHVYSKSGNFTVSLTVETDMGCKNISIQTVTVNPKPLADFILPEICIKDAAALFKNTSSDNSGNITGLSYLWDFGDPSSGTNNFSTLKDPTHIYPREGEFIVKLTVTSVDGCSSVKEKKFIVNGFRPIADFTMSGTAICSGEEIIVEDKSYVSPGKIVRVEWCFDETSHAGDPQYHIIELHPDEVKEKKYSFRYPQSHHLNPQTVKIRMKVFSGTECFSEKTQELTINGLPEVAFDASANICENAGPVQLKAREIYGFPASAQLYMGKGVSPSGIFSPRDAGSGAHEITFSFTAKDGCTVSKKQVISVLPAPKADAGKDLTVLQGGSAELSLKYSSADSIRIKWVPAAGLSNDTIPNPVANPEKDTHYKVFITSKDGCTIEDDVLVKIKDSPEIPNAFSPNGDGKNDVWEIDFLETWNKVNVQVFNRYGQAIFQSLGYLKPWDGMYKGKEVPEGVYYYVIVPPNASKKLTGSITLLR